ncbi:DUF1826 domain-containing protein [Chitinophaga sp. sic0106]|nr:DUF1826 domain-containing protein [Chitinophaga sp. sic0106]
MKELSHAEHQIQYVNNFHDLVATPFHGAVNAICWKRNLTGDFAEIIEKIPLDGNITEIDEEELLALQLTAQGQLAREALLSDWKALEAYGALPSLNVIKYYEQDDTHPFFPTDVYSFHVDRSPIPTATFLCTYYGEASDILPNSQAQQKILIPEIREELFKLYGGPADGFELFLSDNFYDLHYQAAPDASTVNLGLGNLWRLGVDHPGSQVLPCVHRAPKEKSGEKRLLMIC